MKDVSNRFALTLVMSAIVMFSACHKAKVASTPPPPPPPAAPTATLTARPEVVEKGQSTTLTWETTNATDISMDAIGASTESLGAVQATGSQQVTPAVSTTYTLYAKGPGGTQVASARVTVSVPPPPPPPPAGPSEDELFRQYVKNIYFDFDKSDIRSDQQDTIQRDAAFLNQHPMSFTVEGNCDERGSIEYNLALGDRRATTVKQALIAAGVNSETVKTITYGKEKPVCQEHDESCWQQNRRGNLNREN